MSDAHDPPLTCWQRLCLTVQRWCRRLHLPWLHGCLWDRDCRYYGAPPRVYLHGLPWVGSVYVSGWRDWGRIPPRSTRGG